jgi:multidrug efflux pump subunit AcrB
MHGKSDREMVEKTRNTARYFTENRHISWVLLLFTIGWGIFAYLDMPKRKDPDIPVRVAVALASWPGASAERVEELVTTRIEETIAESSQVEKIESTTRPGVAVVTVTLQEEVEDTAKAFDDIWLKLDALEHLPQGVSVDFMKDFGDTAALMLTVASPGATDVEIELRARQIESAIRGVRSEAEGEGERVTLVGTFAQAVRSEELESVAQDLAARARARGAEDVRLFSGPGYVGIDARTRASDEKILATAADFVGDRLHPSDLHPDVWGLSVVRDPSATVEQIAAVAGNRYSYRELEDYTDRIKRALQAVPDAAKVTRAGVLPETIFIEYSQERLASYGLDPKTLGYALSQRNIVTPGGVLQVRGKSIVVAPSGELTSEEEIGDIMVGASSTGAPVYLRDVATVTRGYQSPASFVNEYTSRDQDGRWTRSRAITLAVSMRSGRQIAQLGADIDAALADVKTRLPHDLVMARTSDQPQQVVENVDLFMSSLWEAIVLVVLVALVGFWEWRSALLMALSIPITLAMTFGIMQVLGLDVQQVSIASLIIALGLLVDDPVVAGDAIKRALAEGWKPLVAAWLGPTKLATAILFATITNIVAYLPFLALPGDSGRFVYSLPIVLTCSLVASRLVSMTFIPLLGYYLLRAPKKAEPTPDERRNRGFGKLYYRLVGWAVDHRWAAIGVAGVLLVAGGSLAGDLKTAFFPKDLSYLSYVDVWLPEDAPLADTRAAAARADEVIRETAGGMVSHHEGAPVLRSVTSFVGGGGPRFWFSMGPEQRQTNYAQLIVNVNDKRDTAALVPALQHALSAKIAGARIDVRELESGSAVGVPVSIRISGDDDPTLRMLAERAAGVLRGLPNTDRVRDNWGADTFTVKLEVDPDRANTAGVTNRDVADSSATALNGAVVGSLREGDLQLPIVARLAPSERAQLGDLENLYVFSGSGAGRVPLRQISDVTYARETSKIVRRNHVRTVTVSAFPARGVLASEVMSLARKDIEELQRSAPPGYRVEIGGEEEEQKESFGHLAVVLGISIACITLALVLQFKNAVKPLVVFAAIPFGVVGALASLVAMGAPFGFMAFLGVISLIGVIVSHVIVLFDFIEERHEEGAPLREALLDAGLMRLRPVLITVGATVLGLFPLAAHGGPLWEPLCYAQIGGLTLATVVTLVLVPVIYAIFVLDLRIIRWEKEPAEEADAAATGAARNA